MDGVEWKGAGPVSRRDGVKSEAAGGQPMGQRVAGDLRRTMKSEEESQPPEVVAQNSCESARGC